MATIRALVGADSVIRCLLGAVVVLEVLDGLITYFLVGGGFGQEGNPLLVGLAGDVSLLPVKALGGLLCALLLWDAYKRRPKLGILTAWCAVALLGGIVVWNGYVYLAFAA